MKTVIISTFLLFSLFLLSCKKKKVDFVLTGIVTESTFNGNLSGASVKLYQVPVGSVSEELLGSVIVDTDGKYSFTFPRDKMEKYILRISKSGYFDLLKTVYFSELSVSSENIRNYSTTAKSWVKLTFHNLNPLPSDHLTFIKQSGKEGCAECCPETEYSFYGTLDTSIYCINDGNTYYSYFYNVMGTTDQGINGVNTVAFDTTEIVLNY
ncbi:MAG: hypothetical protein ACK46O_06315 [Flavobacteriia bacterium]|jgi:hypothetical protein